MIVGFCWSPPTVLDDQRRWATISSTHNGLLATDAVDELRSELRPSEGERGGDIEALAFALQEVLGGHARHMR